MRAFSTYFPPALMPLEKSSGIDGKSRRNRKAYVPSKPGCE
jgi:hypothetical protein